MSNIIILQGIPASGKSTWAKKWVEEDPENRIIINRDSIRRAIGPYWVPSREKFVSIIEETIFIEAIKNKYNICVDATNLNPKTIATWERIAKEFRVNYETTIIYKNFEITLEEALERDKNREFSVGEKVIRNFYKKYKSNE